MCPRWWQYYLACYSDVSLKPRSATLPLCSNPLHTFAHPEQYDRALYIPTSGRICTLHTHYKQFDSCCCIVSSNMNRDDGNILPVMTHLKQSVLWPRTSTNVNDALSVSGHHLAKGEGPLLSKDLRL